MPQTAGSSSNLILMACGYGTQPATDLGRGVWKSTDGGATWTQTLTNVWFSGGDAGTIGGECMIFHPTNASEVFVRHPRLRVWRSLDAGSTWTQNTALSSISSLPRSIFIRNIPTRFSWVATVAYGYP